jgi:hypothetical protein
VGDLNLFLRGKLMKKGKSSVKPVRKTRTKSSPKSPVKKKNFLEDVFTFRWLKKAMVGKTQEESLDLLDQWILKKKALSLFF